MGFKAMAGQTITMMHHQSCFTTMENEAYERSSRTMATCNHYGSYWEPSFNSEKTRIILKSACFPLKRTTKHGWRLAFALNTDGLAGNNEQESVDEAASNLGRTRLGRIVNAGGKQLLEKLKSARKNFPMKIFLVLLGFYTANALATILGQTGDWDVLVAGVVVAAIEGIGMLMYRKPPSLSSERLQYFVVMVNYWKAGVCLGLFVDAFKLGS